MPAAKTYGYAAGRFSFNVSAKQGGGRCEACEGAGVREVEMHFLPNVFVTCEVCKGKRYNDATLRVLYKDKSIADMLDTPVDEALELFRTTASSGGSCRRWSTSASATWRSARRRRRCRAARPSGSSWPASWRGVQTGRTLYLLDEPTTGLHFNDVRSCSRCCAAGRQRQHRAGDRAQPRRHQDLRLDHRPRPRGRRGRRPGHRHRHARAGRRDRGASHTGRFLRPMLKAAPAAKSKRARA
jgi:hypothetical protein